MATLLHDGVLACTISGFNRAKLAAKRVAGHRGRASRPTRVPHFPGRLALHGEVLRRGPT
jgi:hypothetical protein